MVQRNHLCKRHFADRHLQKDLDAIVNEPLHYDWEQLRESIKTHGLRNSTLSALMPSETSSQISNATNGIERRAATSASRPERRYFASGRAGL